MSVLKIKNKYGSWQPVRTIKGEKGGTPEKGVDYYTEADQEKLVQEVERRAVGDIETAVDSIIAIQENLIGGGV